MESADDTDLVNQLINELNDNNIQAEVPDFEKKNETEDEIIENIKKPKKKIVKVVQNTVAEDSDDEFIQQPIVIKPKQLLNKQREDTQLFTKIINISKRSVIVCVLFFVFLTFLKKFTNFIRKFPIYFLNVDFDNVELNHLGRMLFAFIFGLCYFAINFVS